MLHLLIINFGWTQRKINLEGHDEESKTFARDFYEDYPNGRVLTDEELLKEEILRLLQTLEGEVSVYYEVVSISEETILDFKTTWNVWYRNKN